MQVTELIDRVKDVFKRPLRKAERYRSASQSLPMRQGRETLESLGERPLLMPAVDIFEDQNELMISVDVPGARPDNTEIRWDERTGLTLHVKAPFARAPGRALFMEFQEDHDWYRAFALPDYVQGEHAESELKSGVLSIRLPKRRSAAARGIPIVDVD